jgi:hypothetical protein
MKGNPKIPNKHKRWVEGVVVTWRTLQRGIYFNMLANNH